MKTSTKITAGLLMALFASGCGAVKGGFNSDPLANNKRYREMHRAGVPEGYPKPVEKTDEVEVPAAPVVRGELPAKTEAPAAPVAPVTSESVAVQVAIPPVALPETYILNFVQGASMTYRLTIQDSKGAAQAVGLPSNLKLARVSGDVYDLTWNPSGLVSKEEGAKFAPFKIKVGSNRVHSLGLVVLASGDVPLVDKISFNTTSVKEGESLKLKLSVRDASPEASKLEGFLEHEPDLAPHVAKIITNAQMKQTGRSSDGAYLFEAIIDSKGIEFPANKTEVQVDFTIGVVRGDVASAGIPQTIKVIKNKRNSGAQ